MSVKHRLRRRQATLDRADKIWGSLHLPTTGGGPPIRVGSICSGMMAEKWACQRLPWTFEKVFSCDKSEWERLFMIENGENPANIFDDVMSETFQKCAPECDLLLAGLQCHVPRKKEGEAGVAAAVGCR